jgi:hypothetical protein
MASTLSSSQIADSFSPAFIPFHVPDIGEEEIAEVVDSLTSGWLTTGPKTRRFEADFANFIGGEVEALAVNSATTPFGTGGCGSRTRRRGDYQPLHFHRYR